MFSKMSLSAKIIGLCVVLLVLLSINVSITIFNLNRIGNELETIAEADIPLTGIVTKVTTSQLEQALNLERLMRYGNLTVQGDKGQELFNRSKKAFQDFNLRVDEEIAKAMEMARLGLEKAHDDKTRTKLNQSLVSLG
ncbi:MAG: hypothetical protein OEZ59_13960, partial [Deltaproteobacteria bacterium]|nr:hypothetical protein [Deltaproteobacteria bacterium]